MRSRDVSNLFSRPARRLGVIVVIGFVAACSPGADLPPLPDAEGQAYHLGPGDQLRIITFGEAQLTGPFRVSDTGQIALPLLGEVHASGMTAPALQEAIAASLMAKNLIRDPSVSVEISEYRPIFVLGEVSRPGQYAYQPGMTVLTAVAVAGGFTYRAVQDTESILRTASGGPVEGRVGRAALVQPGDVVTVFERRF